MDVRMQREVLSPGMEHTDSACFHSVMGVTKGTQGFFYAREKALEEQTVGQTNRISSSGTVTQYENVSH